MSDSSLPHPSRYAGPSPEAISLGERCGLAHLALDSAAADVAGFSASDDPSIRTCDAEQSSALNRAYGNSDCVCESTGEVGGCSSAKEVCNSASLNGQQAETDCSCNSSAVGEPYISIEDVHFSYDGQTEVLRDIILHINKGQYLCVLGKNGSGKSTLARSINALIQPDQGTICVDGLNSSHPHQVIPIRRRVGMVFQNPDDQMVTAVVEDDVAFGPENLGIDREEIVARVNEALDTVGMSEHRYTDPSELSGGQKQRIAIAGVLAMLPDAIIFDESCAMLDPLGRREILAKMRDLHNKGYTIIHITHDMDDVLEAQRVVVVDQGAIIFDGSPALLFSSPAQVLGLGLDIPYSLAISQRLVKRGLIDGLVARRQDLCTQVLEALCQ